MKKITEKIIAAVMAVVVACQFQVPTFAATENIEYVSDVIVSYGEGDAAEADAKAWLTDNGYTVIDTNLNAGAESAASASYLSWATGARSARAVYLGYKTTTDSSQAITSLKAMNMTGSYSYAEYQEVLDQLEDEINLFMEDLEFTLNEWRENYKAGRGKAVEAYNLLNLMYNPDNGNARIGDLLLNETKEEMGDAAYEKLTDEEKLEHLDMTTLLMQGNSDATKYIEQLLAMGADTDTEKTWLNRISDIGTYDDMMDAKEAEAEEQGRTFVPSIADSELAAAYDNKAAILAGAITNLQESFKEYKESSTTLQDSEDKVETFIGKFDSSIDAGVWISDGVLYESLAAFKYPSDDNPDRTLQDFFMQEFDSESEESRQELYPLVAALSDGQRSALEFVSLSELLSQAIITDEEAVKGTETVQAYSANNDPVSVYTGVDRSVYDASSTALTSSARELQNTTQKSYTEGMFGSPFSLMTTIVAGVFTASLASMVGCAITTGVLYYQTSPMRAYERMVEDTVAELLKEDSGYLVSGAEQATGDAMEIINKMAWEAIEQDEQAVAAFDLYSGALRYMVDQDKYTAKAALLKSFQIATGVMVVVTIALGAWTVISGINDLKAYYNADMDLYPIPDRMVDEGENSNGEKTYTYYKAVQSNRVEKGYTEGREALANNADLNGDLGKEWLALYYTKDASAGNPIIVSDVSGFTVVKGQEATPEGMTALTIFDQESPVNLTNEEWVWNDVNGGLYLYYSTGSANYTASVFAGPGKWIIIAAGAVVIATIFFFGGMAIGRKRKKAEA